VAFRSLSRPSSPLSAKASTKCPYALDSHSVDNQFRSQIAEVRNQEKFLFPDAYFLTPEMYQYLFISNRFSAFNYQNVSDN